MSLKYAWACKLCNASNAAEVSFCSACNFPARASAEEVDAARAAFDSRTPFSGRRVIAAASAVPVSRGDRILQVVVGALLLVGVVLARFGLTFEQIVFGWLFLGLACLVAGVAGLLGSKVSARAELNNRRGGREIRQQS